MRYRVKRRAVCDEHLSPIKHLLQPGEIVLVDPDPYINWYGTPFVVGSKEAKPTATLLIPQHVLERA